MFKSIVLAVFLLTFSSAAFADSKAPILNEVMAKAKKLIAEKKIPILISDLDETVIDSLTRRFKQYQDAIQVYCKDQALERSEADLAQCERLMGISQKDFYLLENGYSNSELLEKVGIDPIMSFAKNFLETRRQFYTRYIDLDGSMPGAATYMRAMKKIGAQVYYVSARSKGYEDTLKNITKLGFLAGESEKKFLFLNTQNLDTLIFKKSTLEGIKKDLPENAEVIGLFENEPDNLVRWSEVFPKASLVFVKGNSQESVGKPSAKMHQIKDYR